MTQPTRALTKLGGGATMSSREGGAPRGGGSAAQDGKVQGVQVRDRKFASIIGAMLVLAIVGVSVSKLFPRAEPEREQAPTPDEAAGRAVQDSTRAWEEAAAARKQRVQAAENRRREEIRRHLDSAVSNTMLSGWGGMSEGVGVVHVMSYLAEDPDVASVVRYGQESRENAGYVVGLIHEAFAAYTNEFPAFGTAGTSWKPTQMDPGGTEALPYVLTQLGSCESLPVLLSAYEALQAACRRHRSSQLGVQGADVEQEALSEFGTVLAYACDYCLAHWGEAPERAASLTEGQRRILSEYAEYREELFRERDAWLESLPDIVAEGERDQWAAYEGPPYVFREQVQVMAHARRFLGAGHQRN